VGAERLAKETNAALEFRGGTVEEGQSVVEAGELGWGEGGGSGVRGREGEDFGLGLIEMDAKGGAKSLEGGNKKREVLVRKKSKGVVEIGMGGAARAKAVITRLVVSPALLSAGAEGGVDGGKDLEDDQAGKGGGEGVPLGEAIFLDEMVQGAIRAVEEAFVGFFIHEIKIVDEAV
jgi:hypothetical protein